MCITRVFVFNGYGGLLCVICHFRFFSLSGLIQPVCSVLLVLSFYLKKSLFKCVCCVCEDACVRGCECVCACVCMRVCMRASVRLKLLTLDVGYL